MKPIFSALLAFSMIISLSAAGQVERSENAEKRKIGSFHAVETSAGIEVILTKGSKQELVVTASENEMLEKIRTAVENGVLKVYREDTWKFWNRWRSWKVKVYVSYTTLDGVRASSGGSINAADVDLDKLSVDLNSGAHITITGKVHALDVDGSSGAQFRGYGLIAANCKADVSSGAGIQVTVTKEISAEASSGGYVRFRGDGLIRNIDVSSGGSVKRQND